MNLLSKDSTMKRNQQARRQFKRKRTNVTSSLIDTARSGEHNTVMANAMLNPNPTQLAASAAAHAKQLQPYGYDHDSHHLISRKILPQSATELQTEIARPEHRDIYNASIKGNTFSECMAIILAMLDIAVDGEYDGDKLMEMAVHALRNRRFHGNNPAGMHPDLVPAELVEREGSVSLEFGGAHLDPALALPQPTFDGFSAFMKEQGCQICESREACSKAGRCLGQEAFEEGVKLEEKKE